MVLGRSLCFVHPQLMLFLGMGRGVLERYTVPSSSTPYSPTDKNPYAINVHGSWSLQHGNWLNFRLKIWKALRSNIRSNSLGVLISFNSWICNELAIIVEEPLLASTLADPDHCTQLLHSLTSPPSLWITVMKLLYWKRTSTYQFPLIQYFLQCIRCFEKSHARIPRKWLMILPHF